MCTVMLQFGDLPSMRVENTLSGEAAECNRCIKASSQCSVIDQDRLILWHTTPYSVFRDVQIEVFGIESWLP